LRYYQSELIRFAYVLLLSIILTGKIILIDEFDNKVIIKASYSIILGDEKRNEKDFHHCCDIIGNACRDYRNPQGKT
jgi:hypothetical protein